MPVIDVAISCGFGSAPHFSKCYSDLFGRSPSSERRTLKTRTTTAEDFNIEIEGSYFGTAFKGMNEPLPDAEEDIQVTVGITLSEIYNGSRKKVCYKKKCLGLDGRTIEVKDASVDIIVKPGMCESKKITFDGKGHQSAKRGCSNLKISFKLKDSPIDSNASLFKRV